MKLADIALGILVACAVTMTGLVVHREFSPAGRAPARAAAPRTVPNFEAIAATGRRLGGATARVRIVEFSDFQCPFCAATQQALREVRAKYPNDVALIYRHLPIEAIHPYAFDASLAAECAADQAHFAELSDTLYADQRDIGHRSWGDFSHAAGIADTAALVDCVRKRVYSGRILTDKAAAAKLGIEGTPTFVLNGHVIIGGVSFATLDSAVRSEMGLRKVALSKTIGSR